MARMNWDRVQGESRIRAHGSERLGDHDHLNWLGRALRRNQYSSECPVCGAVVAAGGGWMKRRRAYHPRCLTDWE